ncbi:Uncharacterised protein [Serratia fonticola]|nr:Uncharacterised protein [Serratia fonticola]
MLSENETDLKERLNNLLYCVKKVFQLINKQFSDDDDMHFYSNNINSNYFYFKEVFYSVLETRMKEQYSIAFENSNKLEDDYLNYNNELQSRINAIKTAKKVFEE